MQRSVAWLVMIQFDDRARAVRPRCSRGRGCGSPHDHVLRNQIVGNR